MKKGGMPGGMQQLMKQANQIQNRMKKIQEEFAQKEFEGSSGGGALKVKVNGDNFITDLTIDEDIFKSGDAEMLQDLILTATNDAIKNAKDAYSAEMDKASGGLPIPGML